MLLPFDKCFHLIFSNWFILPSRSSTLAGNAQLKGVDRDRRELSLPTQAMIIKWIVFMFCLMLFRSFTALCACDMVHFAALIQWARPGLTPRFSHINNKKRQQKKKNEAPSTTATTFYTRFQLQKTTSIWIGELSLGQGICPNAFFRSIKSNLTAFHSNPLLNGNAAQLFYSLFAWLSVFDLVAFFM